MQEKSPGLLVIFAGPTGVGKTHVAIKVAKELDTSIINADSRQVYREMIIGTAMPSHAEQSEVRHYFLGHRSINERYDASRYETEVIEFLEEWFNDNPVIIITGGSGLYIDAVYRGIDDLPTVDPEIRLSLENVYATEGLFAIRRKLKIVDPDYYRRVDINNPKRILKALEVYEMTGRPYSDFLTGTAKVRNFSTLMIGLNRPRPELHERINRRVDEMMASGLLDEVRSLIPYRHLNALNTVGYKELFDYFDGKCSLTEAVNSIKAHSRQYARRQLTWFKRYSSIRWFHPDDLNNISGYIRNFQQSIRY